MEENIQTDSAIRFDVVESLMTEVYGEKKASEFGPVSSISEGSILFKERSTGFGKFSPRINLHDFSNRCRLWAYGIGFKVNTESYIVNIIAPAYEIANIHKVVGDPKTKGPYSLERDFEAYEWVLKNKDA